MVIKAFLFSFFVTLVAVWLVLKAVRSMQIVDVPNSRSSHSTPTPRGGGAGVVFTMLVGVSILAYLELIAADFALVALIGGGFIAIIGAWDDIRDLSPRVRLLVQVLVAFASAYFLTDGFRQSGYESITPAIFGTLSALAIVWSINLFNFMDGIDGIAGAELANIGAAIVIAAILRDEPAWEATGSGLLGTSFAFLLFNWQPARVFMGDVGSAFLGFFIAISAMYSSIDGFLSIFFWLIVYALFIVDTGVTLVRRLLRRVNPMQAHSEHAYQHAARRHKSHAKVVVASSLITLLWLTPLALLQEFYANSPLERGGLMFLAYTPLIILVWFLGAGTAFRR